MANKCSITHEYCPFQDAFWAHGMAGSNAADNCPIEKYADSSRPYTDAERERTGASYIIDDTCRYYGISRSKELRKHFTE